MLCVLYIPAISLPLLSRVKWQDKDGCDQVFQLVDLLSARWKKIGHHLMISYNQLESWRIEYRDQSDSCWYAVMNHWLSVGGTKEYPATWKGLFTLLEDIQCAQIALDMEKALTEAGILATS